VENQQILDVLLRLEKEVGGLREDMNRRFGVVDERFNEVNERLENVENRLDDVDKKLVHVTEMVAKNSEDIQMLKTNQEQLLEKFQTLDAIIGQDHWNFRKDIQRIKRTIGIDN
jgi:uncharacterized coiled-coil DUF342 family protein